MSYADRSELLAGLPPTKFNAKLLELIFLADDAELERLWLGFPAACRLVEFYRLTGKVEVKP